MARVSRRTRRELTVWFTLYLYSAELITACAPAPSRDEVHGEGVKDASFALEANFADNYRLSPPDTDAPFTAGGLRGRTPYTHEVTADGESKVTIPLVAPPGRNGVEPHLSFVYGDRANHGLLGRRWDLAGLSRIDACSKSRAFDGQWSENANDELCLDGQRLLPTGTALPTYAKVLQTLDGNTRVLIPGSTGGALRAQDRDGTIREYGTIPGNIMPTTHLQTVATDVWGNRMTISYNDDGSPQLVSYTSNGTSLGATRFVRFAYEPKVVATSRAEGGRLLVMRNRLKAVTMIAPANLNGPPVFVRRYKLAYVSSSDVLASVTECVPKTHNPASGAEADEVCLEPIVLTYRGVGSYAVARQPIPGDTFPELLIQQAGGSFQDIENVANAQVRSVSVLDVDGDGINDIVYMKPGPAPYKPEGGCFGSGVMHEVTHGRWYWRRGSLVFNAIPSFAAEADLGLGDLSLDNASFPPRALDFDGDGEPELIAGITPRCFHSDWPTDWFTGDYRRSDLRTLSLQLGVFRRQSDGTLSPPMAIFDSKALLADFDGDQRVDRLEIQPDLWQWHQLLQSDFTSGSEWFIKTGGLGLLLNNSVPPAVGFQDPLSLLTSNPCHGPDSWPGVVRCGTNCGYNCPPCNHCASDNVPHDARYGANACISAAACPVKAVTFDSAYAPETVPTRVSSFADMLVADLDGNGVNEFVFREAVPHYLIDSDTPVGGELPRGTAWNQADADAPSELPGAQYYAGRMGAGGTSVRTKLGFVSPNGPWYEGVRFVDLNSDGLPDATYDHKGVLTAHLNLGARAFGPPIELNLAAKYPGETFGIPIPGTFTDHGMVNVVVGNHILEMRGDQWADVDWFQAPTGSTRFKAAEGAIMSVGGIFGLIPVDLNNDGMTDIVRFDGSPGAQPTMYYSIFGPSQELLWSVGQPGIRSNRIEHVRHAGAGLSCALPQNCRVPEGLYVVSRVWSSNEHEQEAQYDYAYGDSRTDVNGGGWLGFTSRTVTVAARGYKRVETYPIGLSDRVFGAGACAGCYFYPGARRPSIVVTTRDARLEGQTTAGQVVTRTERFGYVDQRGDGTADTFLSYLGMSWMTETATDANGLVVPIRSARVTTVRTHGTVTSQQTELWEGGAAAGGSPPDPTNVKLVAMTSTLLPDDPVNWLMGLPARTTVSSKWPGSALVERKVAYEYEAGRPVLKSVTVEPDSTELPFRQT